jgi:carbonic anhydrase/acetyltransferase-like protein (isoleucine patch superfamily)
MKTHVLRPIAAGVLLVAAPFAFASSFTDPTALITEAANLVVEDLVFIGPFANIVSLHPVSIGAESNVQDNVALLATTAPIRLGEQVILAHGATVLSRSSIGEEGTCASGAAHCPSFIGFNAVVDGAIIEKDAMVGHLAKVATGVRIPSGRKVLPGKFVQNQRQVAEKTALVTAADRVFMDGVIEVNVSFALNYPILAHEDPSNVRGINYDPGSTGFNPNRDLPTLAGAPTRAPDFRNRIIGDVRMADSLERLPEVMGANISLRADEGEAFELGTIQSMESMTTFHALEHSHIEMGEAGQYGFHSLVHGGPTEFDPAHPNLTHTGANFTLGAESVFFRSRAGDNVTIGFKSLVQQCDLASGTVVPKKTIRICGTPDSRVEW